MIYRNAKVERRAKALKEFHEMILKNGEMVMPMAGKICIPDKKVKRLMLELEPESYELYVLKEFNEYFKGMLDEIDTIDKTVQNNLEVAFTVFAEGFKKGFARRGGDICNAIFNPEECCDVETDAKNVTDFIKETSDYECEFNKKFFDMLGDAADFMRSVFRDGIRHGINSVSMVGAKFLGVKEYIHVGTDGNVKRTGRV